jgi:hypothetical protein
MIEKINKASGLIKNIVYILGLLFAVYVFIGKNAVEKERSSQQDIALEKKVDRLIVADSVRAVKIDTIMENQAKMMKKVNENTKDTKYVIGGFKKHLKATDRLEELLNFYEF